MAGVLVHEWIAMHGGSENVFDQFVQAFPDADIRCLWNDTGADRYPGRTINESWLARTPLRKSKAAALPFMLNAWRDLPDDDYEWALISSHLFAHHATFKNTSPDFHKYVYVHTPARYIWTPELDARGNNPIARMMTPSLKSIDKKRAAEGATFIANSKFVKARIERFWDQEAKVIYPPVAVEEIQSVADWRTKLTGGELAILEALPESFVLGASRFIPYKRLDLVIDAAEAVGMPAVLAGGGPLEAELRAQAEGRRVPVHFVTSPSNELLFALYQAATVFVFPAIEDFGIMPIEAVAAGATTLVNALGGSSECLELGVSGVTFNDDIVHGLESAISISESHSSVDRKKTVLQLGRTQFRDAILKRVSQHELA